MKATFQLGGYKCMKIHQTITFVKVLQVYTTLSFAVGAFEFLSI